MTIRVGKRYTLRLSEKKTVSVKVTFLESDRVYFKVRLGWFDSYDASLSALTFRHGVEWAANPMREIEV